MWPARSKYYNIGIELGVPDGDLDAFEKSNSYRVDGCFMDVLKHLLRRSEGLSQQKLADALASPSVSFGNLANSIRYKRF